MGGSVGKLEEEYKGKALKPNPVLSGLTIEKIKKLHGVFKTLCDGFAINLTEYSQIFGEEGEDTFGLWDTECNSFVDALELFSGLLLFSRARSEDKFHLILELFDFNEIESLSKSDINYLLECCYLSAAKLHNLPSEYYPFDIDQFVDQYVVNDKRIPIDEAMKLFNSNPIVLTFFSIFKIDPIKKFLVSRQIDDYSFVWTPPSTLYGSKRFSDYTNWLSQAKDAVLSKIAQEPYSDPEKPVIPEISCNLKWIYGIHTQANPVIQFNIISQSKDMDVDSRKYLYCCGTVVIIYNSHKNSQQFYLEHKQAVNCICVSANQQFIASAEQSGQHKFSEIHIWSALDLKNLCVYPLNHKGRVQAMAFSCQDKYLISVGALQPSALIIHDWQSGNRLSSISLSEVILDIQPIRSEAEDEIVVLLSKTKLIEVHILAGTPQFTEYCSLAKHHGGFSQEEITTGFLSYTKESFFTVKEDCRCFGITGHQDGTLAYWESGKYPRIIAKYVEPILFIKYYNDQHIIATKLGHIYFWNIPERCTQIIDLSTIDIKLSMLEIISIDTAGSYLLVATKSEVIEIFTDYSGEIEYSRIDKITFNNGKQKALTLINASPTMSYVGIGGESGVVNIYDTKLFNQVDIWMIGYEITALHSVNTPYFGCAIAAGTENGYIYVMNYNSMEDYQISCSSTRINDIKISPDGTLLAAGAEDLYIYLYRLEKNRFMSSASCKLDQGRPISLTFSCDSTMLLLSSNRMNLQMISTESFTLSSYTNEDAKSHKWQQWNGRYSLHRKKPTARIVPFAFSNDFPIIFAADECGNFYVWKYTDDMSTYVLNSYHVHSAPIERLCISFDDTEFFSLSTHDSMLCQWTINTLNTPMKPMDVERLYRDGIDGVSDHINRELQYAYNPSSGSREFKQYVDPTLLVRGIKNKTVNDIIIAESYEKHLEQQLKPPIGSLWLEQIYGFQCCCRRNSLQYDHFLDKEEVKKPKKANNIFIDSMEEDKYQEDEKSHKFVCYYASKYVILDDLVGGQFIYQGHKAKVTCVVPHPSQPIYASGECGQDRSEVHFWDSRTREPLIVLKTIHEISMIDFSGDGQLLLTFGSGKQCLQVFKWQQEREIAFRHINIAPIFDIKFNPFDSNHIIAIGVECILEFRICSGSLTISNIISSTQLKYFTIFLCMDFLEYSTTSSNAVDVFFGTSTGEVGVLSGSKYTTLFEKIHDGAINVIKINKLLIKPFCFITAGDDNVIKIWDSDMVLIAGINVTQMEIYKQAGLTEDIGGIQSIDLYGNAFQTPLLLLGMRNGDAIEIKILIETEEDKTGTAPKKFKITLDSQVTMKNHSSQGLREDERNLCISLHPNCIILASGSFDGTLRLWDTLENRMIKNFQFSKKLRISSLAFSILGNLLAVGFAHGQVILYSFSLSEDLEKEDSPDAAGMDSDPVIEVKSKFQDSKGAVLLIKFSFDDSMMAISYDAEKVRSIGSEKADGKQGSSFVIIYTLADPSKPPTSSKVETTYKKLVQINFPYAHTTRSFGLKSTPISNEITESTSDRAFTHLDFSGDNGFLQLCYTYVSLHGKPDYTKPVQYLVWDLKRSQGIEDWQLIRKVDWQQWSIAPTVYARILNNKLSANTPEEEKDQMDREEVTLSALSLFGRYNEFACAGAANGDVHLFKASALKRSNNAINGEGIVRKETMDIAKSYNACCSAINCIEICQGEDQNYILISSYSDEVILKFRFEPENKKWDLDYYDVALDRADPYSEFPTPEKFHTLYNEYWTPRARIFELSEKLSLSPPPCNLKIDWVFGRKANDRRNNVVFDFLNRIVYHLGTMMVIHKEDLNIPPKDTEKSQKIFPSTRNLTAFTSPEISSLCMNFTKQLVALGTAEAKAHIYVWDISHDTEVSAVSLPNVSMVCSMKFNKNNRHIAAVCLSRECRQVIIHADIKLQTVLTSTTLVHSLPYKIRDISFVPGSSSRFITSGIQHLAFWQINGKYMEAKCAEFMIPKIKPSGMAEEDLLGVKHKKTTFKHGAGMMCQADQIAEVYGDNPDYESVYCTFMGIGFVNELVMLTIADDGCIYIWDNLVEYKLLKKRKGHDDVIMCMDITSDGLVATGGNDGYVVLWKFNYEHEPLNRDLEQICSVQVPKMTSALSYGQLMVIKEDEIESRIKAAEYIQSVSFSENNENILVGTRSGAVYTASMKILNGNQKFKFSESSIMKKIIDGIDDEKVQSIAYDEKNNKLLILSQAGFFGVWSLNTKLLVYYKHFRKATKYLYVFSNEQILLGFETEVNMLSSNYDIIESYSIKKNLITAIQVSNNEKVVAIAGMSSKSPELEIYDIERKFHEYHSIKGYKAKIIKIDFTSDDKYMACMDEWGSSYIYSREELLKIAPADYKKYSFDWKSFGLKIEEKFKDIMLYYPGDNKITAICKLPKCPFVAVGDFLGSFRFFHQTAEPSQTFSLCRCEHLNILNQILTNSNSSVIFTFSENDCCIQWGFKENLQQT